MTNGYAAFFDGIEVDGVTNKVKVASGNIYLSDNPCF